MLADEVLQFGKIKVKVEVALLMLLEMASSSLATFLLPGHQSDLLPWAKAESHRGRYVDNIVVIHIQVLANCKCERN